MQCSKCKQQMTKRAVITSANSRYQQWQCPGCRNEQTQAIGLTMAMPKDQLYGTR